MKILLAAQQSPHAYPIPAYSFWAEAFRNAIREAGHSLCEVPQADWAKGLLPLSAPERDSWKEITWAATVQTARKERPDFFLSYFFPPQVHAPALAELRQLGVPSVNFFCDHVRDYTDAPPEFAPFDLHWVPEIRALGWYRARGWKALHAPMATWAHPTIRSPQHEEIFPPTFIGAADSLRIDLLGRAIRAGAPIEVRGPSWENNPAAPSASPPRAAIMTQLGRQWTLVRHQGWRAFLNKLSYNHRGDEYAAEIARQVRPACTPGQEFLETLRASRVAIGINRYPTFRRPFSQPDVYSRLRDIEAPMAGACYLTEWAEDLPFWYDLGREIETYRDADELVSKIDELEKHPELRQRLRIAGQTKALRELTIERTLNRIGEMLGLSSS